MFTASDAVPNQRWNEQGLTFYLALHLFLTGVTLLYFRKEDYSFPPLPLSVLNKVLWMNCALLDLYVEVLTPGTSECECIWRRGYFKKS